MGCIICVYVGFLLASLEAAGVLVQAQTIWSNALIHPWATSLRCSGTALVATVSSQPAGCLYASGANDGAQILFATCNNQNVQRFNIVKDSASLYKFTNVNNKKCMDGWGQGTGGQIKQYDCESGTQPNQKFTLEYTRAVTGCAADWSSYRIKIGSQCVTISGSQLVWQACAGDKMTPSQNFFIQNGSAGRSPPPPPPPPPSGGGTCQPFGYLTPSQSYAGSDTCKKGSRYPQYRCSPPVTTSTRATLTVNDFSAGGDGGAESYCDGKFHSNSELIVALSTGWFNNLARCFNRSGRYIQITAPRTGKVVNAKVVDECDSANGCDSEHAYQPPCKNNIVDASSAVWSALGIKKSDSDYGYMDITWRDV